jgi:triosephosphate isomerase (TIM)
MARTPFVCGNWKMFTNAQSGKALAAAVAAGVQGDRVRVGVCPPFPYLALISETLAGSRVSLGAQNLYPAFEGAFTGEVSPAMLKDVGCRFVIVGHSERRHGLGEKNAFINHKVKSAFAVGLEVILCVGETLEERQTGQTEAIIQTQLDEGLQGIPANEIALLVVAYEPVWAIGTGHNATPEQAQQAHQFIRGVFARRFGSEAAKQLVIQYGGSVKPDNSRAILSQSDVDGALVGGASLQADSFLAIVAAART